VVLSGYSGFFHLTEITASIEIEQTTLYFLYNHLLLPHLSPFLEKRYNYKNILIE
jgi:hypothetical protein